VPSQSSSPTSPPPDTSQAPVAVDDFATIDEDAGATAINVLANDTDPDGGPKMLVEVQSPANGQVAILGGGSELTYRPDENYCNAGFSPDVFAYSLNGGSNGVVSVTVLCVDDAPTARNDSVTVAQDSGSTTIDVLANDTDLDGGSKSITFATDPANGTVGFVGAPGSFTALSYQPDFGFCSVKPDEFEYGITGGSAAVVSVTVTCGPKSRIATYRSAQLR
jgi:hypothetical protein